MEGTRKEVTVGGVTYVYVQHPKGFNTLESIKVHDSPTGTDIDIFVARDLGDVTEEINKNVRKLVQEGIKVNNF